MSIKNKKSFKFNYLIKLMFSSYKLLYFSVCLFVLILWVYIYLTTKSNPSLVLKDFFYSIWSPTHFHLFNLLINSLEAILLLVFLPGIIFIPVCIALFTLYIIFILITLFSISVINLFFTLKLKMVKI
jgi:hypothetical protein